MLLMLLVGARPLRGLMACSGWAKAEEETASREWRLMVMSDLAGSVTVGVGTCQACVFLACPRPERDNKLRGGVVAAVKG